MADCKKLGYKRSLSPSKAIFYYKNSENDFITLPVETTKVTSTKSGYSEAYQKNHKPKNLQPQDLANSNIFTVDVCYVPPLVNSVYCRFSLRVNSNSLEPEECTSDLVRAEVAELARLYKSVSGYKELATRIAKNILCGYWLWRNQNACPISISIQTTSGSHYYIKDAVRLYSTNDWKSDEKLLNEFSTELASALSDPMDFWSADIIAKMQPHFSQEIFPSQKVTDGNSGGGRDKKLVTAKTESGEKSICFSAFKVGAALQNIDDWWDDDADYCIRTNEYGIDKKRGVPLRTPKKGNDFYTLLRSQVPYFIDELKQVGSCVEISSNIHYFMSVLIKGGMFTTLLNKNK